MRMWELYKMRRKGWEMRTWERKKNAKANKDEVKENRKGRKTERKEVCTVNSIVLMLTLIIHNKVFTWYRISLYVDKTSKVNILFN